MQNMPTIQQAFYVSVPWSTDEFKFDQYPVTWHPYLKNEGKGKGSHEDPSSGPKSMFRILRLPPSCCNNTLTHSPSSVVHCVPARYTLHTAHFTLHAAHSRLHNAQWKLHTTHCTLCTESCTLHTAQFTLHTENLTLLLTANWDAVAAYWTLTNLYYTLDTAQGRLHTAQYTQRLSSDSLVAASSLHHCTNTQVLCCKLYFAVL